MTWEETKLILSDEVKKTLDARHVLENEVKKVIFHAEDTGEKLYRPGTDIFLAKLKIGAATFYAEYSAETDGYSVRSAYVHKAEIQGA
jgi:hypothetical protein